VCSCGRPRRCAPVALWAAPLAMRAPASFPGCPGRDWCCSAAGSDNGLKAPGGKAAGGGARARPWAAVRARARARERPKALARARSPARAAGGRAALIASSVRQRISCILLLLKRLSVSLGRCSKRRGGSSHIRPSFSRRRSPHSVRSGRGSAS
jgi:hypothetical protein